MNNAESNWLNFILNSANFLITPSLLTFFIIQKPSTSISNPFTVSEMEFNRMEDNFSALITNQNTTISRSSLNIKELNGSKFRRELFSTYSLIRNPSWGEQHPQRRLRPKIHDASYDNSRVTVYKTLLVQLIEISKKCKKINALKERYTSRPFLLKSGVMPREAFYAVKNSKSIHASKFNCNYSIYNILPQAYCTTAIAAVVCKVKKNNFDINNFCSRVTEKLFPYFAFVYLRLINPLWIRMTTQFTKLFSFILASVNDPPPQLQPAYRMQCHSCMSAYMEDQYMYIAHLYRKPLAFTEKCDRNNFDARYLRAKNCTDACVTLRVNDKVGGRRRNGYLRGCLSDILHYNQSAIRSAFDVAYSSGGGTASAAMIGAGSGSVGPRAGKTKQLHDALLCSYVRFRDLFLQSDRYTFDVNDHVEVCTCVRALCNSAAISAINVTVLWAFAISTLFMVNFQSYRYGSNLLVKSEADDDVVDGKNDFKNDNDIGEKEAGTVQSTINFNKIICDTNIVNTRVLFVKGDDKFEQYCNAKRRELEDRSKDYLIQKVSSTTGSKKNIFIFSRRCIRNVSSTTTNNNLTTYGIEHKDNNNNSDENNNSDHSCSYKIPTKRQNRCTTKRARWNTPNIFKKSFPNGAYNAQCEEKGTNLN